MSETEKSSPKSSPSLRDTLISIAAAVVKGIIESPAEREDAASGSFWQAVKLVHADDLQKWGSFKEYSEHNSITYAEYREGVKRIKALKKQVNKIIKTQERLEVLEKGDFEEYDTIEVDVPRSFFRKELEIPLPDPPYENTKMTCSIGEIKDGNLYVKGKWGMQQAIIFRSCPSGILHKEELDSIRQWLKELPQEDLDIVNEIKTSRFSYPVLFISHRWESIVHPDPEGHQYRKLSKLQNCFMIYDYSSFPQRITNESEKAALENILTNMNQLIKNVVILKSPTYIERGWCIYEYILASLTLSAVCDEIRDPDFVRLRNFRATRPTLPENVFRGHSIDSSIQNSIAAEILQSVNRILPRFSHSLFTVEEDRKIVTELLLSLLLAVLPPKKEYPSPYLGEWIDVPWTREELQDAFQKEIQWGSLYTSHSLNPYQLKVPDTLEEAMASNYSLDTAPPNTSMTWLERILGSGPTMG